MCVHVRACAHHNVAVGLAKSLLEEQEAGTLAWGMLGVVGAVPRRPPSITVHIVFRRQERDAGVLMRCGAA